MRQIFTSPRLENVEGVAQLLRDAGIDIRLNDGRSYKQVSRREFSYIPARENQQGPQPTVWVINADDYKRARDLLADAGLLDESKTSSSYLPAPLQFKSKDAVPAERKINRMRLALLFVVGAMALGTILRMTVLR